MPLPEGPTIETKAPCGIVKDTSLRTASDAVPLGYSLVSERATSMRQGLGLVLGGLLAIAACGGTDKNANDGAKDSGFTGGAAAAVRKTDRAGRIPVLFVGTSLTAGLGLDPDSAWPARVERLADSINWKIDAQNAGLSGETSAGTLRRMDWLLTQPAEYIIIETGANDGLRGLNVDSTRRNIEAIIKKVREVKPQAKLFLVQMEAPPNMGQEYTADFHDMYGEISQGLKVRLLPFLLQDVAGKAELNQADGIHPNDKGSAIVAANFWKVWGPLVIPGLTVK